MTESPKQQAEEVPQHEVDAPPAPKAENSWQGLLAMLSSFGLASALLFLLLILTWFGTLEQKHSGLYLTAKKYFSSESYIIFPELYFGKTLPIPLPNAFWVSVLLFINMLAGGILRARKGWKKAGVLISHAGILMLLLGGAITHFASTRGLVALYPGESADARQSFTEMTIEISEVVDGKIVKVFAVPAEFFKNREPEEKMAVNLPEFPFDLEVTGWHKNGTVMRRTGEGKLPESTPVVGEYFVSWVKPTLEGERNNSHAYVRIKPREGEVSDDFFILRRFDPYAKTFRVGERTFLAKLRPELMPMAFELSLDSFDYAYHPGTARPKYFKSVVERVDDRDGNSKKASVVMNEPLRFRDYTVYQASWGHRVQGDITSEAYSVFEVVKDPATQWPRWALWIVTIGLGIHFLTMLYKYLSKAMDRIDRNKTKQKEGRA